MIRDDFSRIDVCFNKENPLKIKIVEEVVRQKLLATVELNILNNYGIVKKLIGEAATIDKVKAYFKQVELYTFSQDSLNSLLNGLSSFDGSRMYYRDDIEDSDDT